MSREHVISGIRLKLKLVYNQFQNRELNQEYTVPVYIIQKLNNVYITTY